MMHSAAVSYVETFVADKPAWVYWLLCTRGAIALRVRTLWCRLLGHYEAQVGARIRGANM